MCIVGGVPSGSLASATTRGPLLYLLQPRGTAIFMMVHRWCTPGTHIHSKLKGCMGVHVPQPWPHAPNRGACRLGVVLTMVLLDPGDVLLGFIASNDFIARWNLSGVFTLSMKVALAPCPMGSMTHPVWVTNTCISQAADWGPSTCFVAARQISREASGSGKPRT